MIVVLLILCWIALGGTVLVRLLYMNTDRSPYWIIPFVMVYFGVPPLLASAF